MLLTLEVEYREISNEKHYTIKPFRRGEKVSQSLFNKLARKYPVGQSFAARVFARPTKLLVACEEKPLVPRVARKGP